MIKVDEEDPIGELEASFPYRDVKIKKGEDVKKYYDLEGELGRGKFGTVFKCKEKGSKLTLAAKFVHIERRQDRQNVEREVDLMRTLQHPRLIQLYDAFETDNIMCVVLELIEGGELFERVIDDDFVLTEKACTAFMRQICEGVEFIHRNNIIHLDLKPENILCLTKTGNRIKIIDFGLARKYEPDKKLQVLFGTPEFVAPEVVNFELISFATDMWSVGVICYVLLSGLSPFMGETDLETMSNVTLGTFDFDDESFDEISADAKDFISKLLIKNQAYRITASECLAHPWLKKKPPKQLISCLDPNKDNLKIYVEKFLPHNGINFVDAIEEQKKSFQTQFNEMEKQKINPNMFRSLCKDSLLPCPEKIINDNKQIKSFHNPHEIVPYQRNMAENIFKGKELLLQDLYGEKAVRHKLTLTPIVKDLFLPKDNSSLLQPNCNYNPNQNTTDDLSKLQLNDSENITNTTFFTEQTLVQQNNNTESDKTNIRRYREAIRPIYSSFSKFNEEIETNENDNPEVKQRIIIPTIFGEINESKLLAQNQENIIDLNVGLTSQNIEEDRSNDVKWSQISVKVSNIPKHHSSELLSTNSSNQLNNNQLKSISSVLECNTLKIYENNITEEQDDKKSLFLGKAIAKEFPGKVININEIKTRKKLDNTNQTADNKNQICTRVMAVPPIINISTRRNSEQTIPPIISINSLRRKSELSVAPLLNNDIRRFNENSTNIGRNELTVYPITRIEDARNVSEKYTTVLERANTFETRTGEKSTPVSEMVKSFRESMVSEQHVVPTSHLVKSLNESMVSENSVSVSKLTNTFNIRRMREIPITNIGDSASECENSLEPITPNIGYMRRHSELTVPPIFTGNDRRRKSEFHNIRQYFETNTNINMYQNEIEKEKALQYDNTQEISKVKLKSTPPWFSNTNQTNTNDIPQRRTKFKFSVFNRDVPLYAPIRSEEIEKYLGINNSNCDGKKNTNQ